MNFKNLIFLVSLFIFPLLSSAQHGYWQQQADYDIAIDFDHEKDIFRGKQIIKYSNNSPDTLRNLFFHLYYNAFQPNSMFDQWAQNIPDPEKGLDYKLKYLTSSETGWIKISQFIHNGKQVPMTEKGSILQIHLEDPLLPGSEESFEMSFSAKIPLLCRRTGRDNDEGIDYSMSQWYPKLCVYDDRGWHPTPFLGREFYSNFGNYEVRIRIDSSFVLAAGADIIESDTLSNSNKKQWYFKSDNVLDFSWAADPDYQHYYLETDDGIQLNFYYQEAQNVGDRWKEMGEPLRQIFPYLSKRFGQYPYKSYTIIQAGDGATEYSKSTFITGDRSLGSLVGVSIHEMMHSWYQHVLASDENSFPWLDEGFASFAATEVKKYMRDQTLFFKKEVEDPFGKQYDQYALIAKSGFEEAMNTPANYYQTNTAYRMASYSKGELFLNQLRYIVGEEVFNRGLMEYYKQWKFKHPRPSDFIRIMEKTSDMHLDWFQHFWINTTHYIDYAIGIDTSENEKTTIVLQKIGVIPMPIEVDVNYLDGSNARFIIPINIQYGNKKLEDDRNKVLLNDWPWTHRQYTIQLNVAAKEIKSLHLDPDMKMADINRINNRWERMKEVE